MLSCSMQHVYSTLVSAYFSIISVQTATFVQLGKNLKLRNHKNRVPAFATIYGPPLPLPHYIKHYEFDCNRQFFFPLN
jgi:hypothetical protein